MQNKEGFWMELQLEHLSKTYGTVQALKDISYTFKPGIYGILGKKYRQAGNCRRRCI